MTDNELSPRVNRRYTLNVEKVLLRLPIQVPEANASCARSAATWSSSDRQVAPGSSALQPQCLLSGDAIGEQHRQWGKTPAEEHHHKFFSTICSALSLSIVR